MPKIDVAGLTSKDKKRLKVWEKKKIIIEIGAAHYEVEPQPARAVLQFKDLIQLYVEQAQQYKDWWSKKEEGEEEEQSEQKEIGLDDFKGLAETIIESPFYLLLPFVPDLDREDADAAPWGQTFHNLSVLCDINGLGWGEAILKEYIIPFVPDLLQSALALGAGTMRARTSAGVIGPPTSASSSMGLPENPTDSTPPEP